MIEWRTEPVPPTITKYSTKIGIWQLVVEKKKNFWHVIWAGRNLMDRCQVKRFNNAEAAKTAGLNIAKKQLEEALNDLKEHNV